MVRKATKKVVAVKKPVRNDPRVSGKTLTGLPVYNGRDLEGEDVVTRGIVRNIRSRRSFTEGREFINRVADSVAIKFPTLSRKAVDGRVCRVLARFF